MTLADLPRFPCTHDKRPLTPHGFYDAQRDCDHSSWPLVGVRTGATSGIDVLDIDPDGMEWLAQNEGRLPPTRRHRTQRGVHLLFAHASGLRNSEGRIAKGVDVRAEGGFVIWWPRQGYAVVGEDCVSEWPGWLLKKVRGVAANKNRHSSPPSPSSLSLCVEDVGALSKLNPCDWKDHARWLRLMMSCHAAGIEREAFIRWSTSDPDYAGDGEIIGRRWDSLRRDGGVSAAILLTELRRAGKAGGMDLSVAVLGGASTNRVRSLKPWLDAIQRSVERAKGSAREPALFNAACTMAEIIGEGRLKLSVAVALLEGSARACGLWHELGADEVRRTVANGLRFVEEKILATMEK